MTPAERLARVVAALEAALEPEALARAFHEAYERLAPQFGYEMRKETRAFDAQSPNGRLMVAVCGEATGAHRVAHAASLSRGGPRDDGFFCDYCPPYLQSGHRAPRHCADFLDVEKVVSG